MINGHIIIEMCQKIKQDDDNTITPIIVLSSNIDHGHRIELLKLGIAHFIKNPIVIKNKYNYTYWYGQNDTMLVLKSVNTENDTTDLYEDEIYISYVWLKGDELLLQASDTLKQEAINKEKEIYGNNSTNGL